MTTLGCMTPARFPLAILSWLVVSAIVNAHPISLSSATVDVREESIVATIEIMLEDLVLYHSLSAGADATFSAADLHRAAETHRDFLARYLTFRNGDGEGISVEVAVQDASQIAAMGVVQTELMSRSIVYEIVGQLEEPVAFLTIMQSFGGAEAILPAVMDVMLLHNGVLVDRPVQITHGRPHTIRLDWENPPSSAPRGFAALRKQRQQQFRERLGIASYGGLYSYLYVTPTEVRHEVLVPLLTLEQWLPIDRRDPEFLEVEEQIAATERIKEFFGQHSSIRINGDLVSPNIARIQFFGLDANDFAVNATARRLNVYQARLGIIIHYRHPDVAGELEMQWSLFNDFAPFLRTVILSDQCDPQEHVFHPNDATLNWKQTKASRLMSIQGVAARSAVVKQGRQRAVMGQLLANVYQAFQQQSDEAIYDSLATSATDSLLPDLYLQIKRALVMTEQGGDLSSVSDLDILSVAVEKNASTAETRYRCRWRVEGSVEHWGHVHTRVNEYDAVLTLQSEQGLLKLAGLNLLDAKHIRFQTSLRQSKTPQ